MAPSTSLYTSIAAGSKFVPCCEHPNPFSTLTTHQSTWSLPCATYLVSSFRRIDTGPFRGSRAVREIRTTGRAPRRPTSGVGSATICRITKLPFSSQATSHRVTESALCCMSKILSKVLNVFPSFEPLQVLSNATQAEQAFPSWRSASQCSADNHGQQV